MISKRIAMEKVSVRKAEKGTKPKLFYAGVDGDLLNPTMMEPQETHFWAEKDPGEDLYALRLASDEHSVPGAAREVYDVPHITPWGKKIASYLWTKSISAGVLLLSALFLNMGFDQDAGVLSVVSPIVSLIFLAATMALLVLDLKKPSRFIYIFTKPNLNSWLVLGGYVLTIFGILLSAWLALMLTGNGIHPLLVWATATFAVASAGYSAFLFAQARGRDFWQSPLLFWHLLIQAIAAGAATLTLIGSVLGVTLPLFSWLGHLLVISLCVSLAMVFGELFMKHGAEDAVRAGDMLLRGPLKKSFWLLVVGLGTVLPIVLVLWPISSLIPNIAAALLALFGLWMYEHLWVRAGQAVPLS
jgi:formate-dependent nitrite reductase membrane component NrfD